MSLRDINMVEMQHIIAACRVARDEIVEQRIKLEERLVTIGDGERQVMNEAILHLSNQSAIYSTIITKLWVILTDKQNG